MPFAFYESKCSTLGICKAGIFLSKICFYCSTIFSEVASLHDKKS